MHAKLLLAIAADIGLCYFTSRFLQTSLFFRNCDVFEFPSLHTFLDYFLWVFNRIQFLALAWQLQNVYTVVHKLFFTDLTECFGSLFVWKVIFGPSFHGEIDVATGFVTWCHWFSQGFWIHRQIYSQKTSSLQHPDSQLEECF